MPLLIISDTSPVRALQHLNLLQICRDLYGTVVIPAAVQNELLGATTTCASIDVNAYPWFSVRSAQDPASATQVPGDLDPGETEAIRLALELRADLVLMDERKGTAAAHALGLKTIGVFGILLEAKRAGIIQQVMPFVEALVTGLNFFASPALRKRLATLAGE